MKTNLAKFFLLPALMAIVILSGCNKNNDVTPQDNQSIKDLNVSPSFDWKTSKDITLNVTGLPVPVAVKNVIAVKSTDGKAVFYTDQLEMNKNYALKFSVPAYITQVVINYGTISQTVDLSSNTIDFTYSVQQ